MSQTWIFKSSAPLRYALYIIAGGALSVACGTVAQKPEGNGDAAPDAPVQLFGPRIYAPAGSAVLWRTAANPQGVKQEVPATGMLDLGGDQSGTATVIVPAAIGATPWDHLYSYLAVAPQDELWAYAAPPTELTIDYQVKLPNLPAGATVDYNTSCTTAENQALNLAAPKMSLPRQCKRLRFAALVRVNSAAAYVLYAPEVAIDANNPMLDLSGATMLQLAEHRIGFDNPEAVPNAGWLQAIAFDGEIKVGSSPAQFFGENSRATAYPVPLPTLADRRINVELALRGENLDLQTIQSLGTLAEVATINLAAYKLPWVSGVPRYDVTTRSITWTETANAPSNLQPHAITHTMRVNRAGNMDSARPNYEHHIVGPADATKTIMVPALPMEFAQYEITSNDVLSFPVSELLAHIPGGYRHVMGRALTNRSLAHMHLGASGRYVVSRHQLRQ